MPPEYEGRSFLTRGSIYKKITKTMKTYCDIKKKEIKFFSVISYQTRYFVSCFNDKLERKRKLYLISNFQLTVS